MIFLTPMSYFGLNRFTTEIDIKYYYNLTDKFERGKVGIIKKMFEF